eukprot:GAHX01002508.1.p1 GENE.GAHX01002508.1~~GAHX01002508.1.p1  ORF type:complete len:419 (-),score=58.61 GAHX01002508.1:47-1303(-)
MNRNYRIETRLESLNCKLDKLKAKLEKLNAPQLFEGRATNPRNGNREYVPRSQITSLDEQREHMFREKHVLEIVHKIETNTDYARYNTTLTNLMDTLYPLYKGLQITPFGSFSYGLLLPGTSDLDIGIHFSFEELEYTKWNQRDILKMMYRHFPNDGYSKLAGIFQARVPVIKLKDLRTNVYLDISVSDKYAFWKTRLMNIVQNFDPRVREVILLVRKWAQTRKNILAPNNQMNPFGWTLLVIAFLMELESPIIPKELMQFSIFQSAREYGYNFEMSRNSKRIRGIDYPANRLNLGRQSSNRVGSLEDSNNYIRNLCNNSTSIECKMTTNELLFNFFQKYRYFNFERQMVSLFHGGFTHKNIINIMERHKTNMVILDPFCESDNVGRNVNIIDVFNFHNEMKRSMQLMEENNIKKLFE